MALTPNNQTRTLWWAVAAVAGLVLLAFGAFWFVNSATTGRALEKAEALHDADMTLAAQDIAMKSIGQLVLIAQDAADASASQADVTAAETEADRSIAELGNRYESLDSGLAEELKPQFDAWQSAASTVISLSGSGQPGQAADELVTSLVPASNRLAVELTAERDSQAQAVDDSTDSVNAMARAVGFLTIFLIPVLAIIGYRIAARRQLEGAAAHLDARVEAEKELGRAKDKFLANVSRELRNPLTSIYGFSEVLLEQGFVDPQAGDLVGLINTESAELARMVEDLLVAAHDDRSPLPIESDVVEMETEIREVIAPFEKRGNAVGGTWGSGVVVADTLRVRQILRNLIANAVEHGGPNIRVYGDAAGSRYVVSVEDDGPGVPSEIVDRLFTRFVHDADARLAGGSVGLGLAVAHQLARAMGGSLDYERVGNRTAFVLSLPLAVEARAAAAGPDTTSEE